MKPLSKDILDKIIDINLAKGKDTIGPGSFVTLKRHIRSGGKDFHPSTRVGRVEKITGDTASVYWRYNDRRKGSSMVKDIPLDRLHQLDAGTAHKLHKILYKGLVDETPPMAEPEKVSAPETPSPGTNLAGNGGDLKPEE